MSSFFSGVSILKMKANFNNENYTKKVPSDNSVS
jgi:hypothetical protein